MIIIKIESNSKIVNYIKPNMKTDNFHRLHKLRIKQALFGEIYTYFHPEMNFNNSNILIDYQLDIEKVK